MTILVSRLIRDRAGTTSIEYAVVAALLSLGIMTGLQSVGAQLANPLTKISVKLMEANKTPGFVPRS